MSNFYYCNDCKKPVDVRTFSGEPYKKHYGTDPVFMCRNCFGMNVKAIIDTPSGEKEKA